MYSCCETTYQTGDEEGLVGITNGFWVFRGLVCEECEYDTADLHERTALRTVLLGFLELLSLLFLPLFPSYLPLCFFGVGEGGLLALLHAISLATSVSRVDHALSPGLAQLGEDGTNAVDIFGADTVNVLVKRTGVGEGRSGGEELEEVGWEKVGARHGRQISGVGA